jgi:hypothetical protein
MYIYFSEPITSLLFQFLCPSPQTYVLLHDNCGVGLD